MNREINNITNIKINIRYTIHPFILFRYFSFYFIYNLRFTKHIFF